MIIKIIRTKSSSNLLDYLVGQENEILDAKGILPYQDLKEIKNEFYTRELTNSRAVNVAYNIIVSFPVEDTITKSMRLDLLEEIMLEFNGGSNLWLAVSHCDTENHQHFHIALSAIKLDGVTIDMAHFAKRAMALSRKLEIKYGLKQVSSERTLFSNHAINDLKLAIDHSIDESGNMAQFIEIMHLCGYKCKVGRGITFIKLENNHPIKGSDVGREYSLGNLKKNFESLSNYSKDDVKPYCNDENEPKVSLGPALLDLILPSANVTGVNAASDENESWNRKKRKKRRRR